MDLIIIVLGVFSQLIFIKKIFKFWPAPTRVLVFLNPLKPGKNKLEPEKTH